MIGLVSALGAVGFVILWAEVVHWRASRSLTSPDRGGSEAVVVLGYRNRRSEHANWFDLRTTGWEWAPLKPPFSVFGLLDMSRSRKALAARP